MVVIVQGQERVPGTRMKKPISPVDKTCTFWMKGQCDSPYKKVDACWTCAEEMARKYHDVVKETRNPLDHEDTARILAWNKILKSWSRLTGVHSLDPNVYTIWYRPGQSWVSKVPPADTKYEQPKG